MPPKASDRPSKKVAPGVIERHARGCRYRPGRKRCNCSPTYRVEIQATVDGKTQRYTETFSSVDEARSWRSQAKRDLRDHGAISPVRELPAPPTFRQAATDFLRRAKEGTALNRTKQRFAQATVDSYETNLRRHVLVHVDERSECAFGDLRVDRIDHRTAQAMIDAVTVQVSPATARAAGAAVSAILGDLYNRKILDDLPPRLRLPAPPKARTRTTGPEEWDKLLASARNDDEARGDSLMEPLVALLVFGGLRISEALGTTWGPNGLDIYEKALTVSRASTKTEAGARVIGLDDECVSILRRHRMATGRRADGALVFSDEKGRPLGRGGRVRSRLAAIRADAGVDTDFHTLRRSHGSALADAGLGAHDIAARLGHTDPAFTMRTYVQSTADLRAAPEALEKLRRAPRGRGRT
jgi:integrase